MVLWQVYIERLVLSLAFLVVKGWRLLAHFTSSKKVEVCYIYVIASRHHGDGSEIMSKFAEFLDKSE